jgi:acyl-CoA synthetase (AMP-forming)/AMP-acid ligase II
VSVIGRADRDWGEAVVAYIVPAEGQTFDEESLEAYCLENMARFKRPKYYRSLASLPKNNYGKVLKTELRELETRHYAGE